MKPDVKTVLAHFWRVLLIGTCLLLTLASCATGLSDTAEVDVLILKVETDRSQAQVGVPIQIRFTVTNTGTRMRVAESDKPVMDVTVRALGSDEDLQVWSVEHPDQVAHRLVWQPGESKTIEWAWTPKAEDVSSGSRHIVGVSGLLNWAPQHSQGAGVSICAAKCY